MRDALLFTLLLLTCRAPAQSARTQGFVVPCVELRPKAEAFLQEHRWKLGTPGSADACAGCVTASTDALRDAEGHRLLSRGGIVRTYTTRKVQPKPPGPVWLVHSPIHVAAKLTLEPVPTGCDATLSFEYTWYGAELLLGFPVDGDPDGAPSNGRLENEYLDRLREELRGRSASATP